MIHLTDIPTILTLVGLELVLSADNAIVLAALAHSLPKDKQKLALFYGILGAFILRFIAIACAQWIIQFWFLQFLGGGYLIWLALSHLTNPEDEICTDASAKSCKARSFWGTVFVIELTDLAFAVDSVLAAVAMSDKLWVIYTGAIIGLIAMRFAAVAVLNVLKVFPALITYAYVLVGWIGIKLVLQGCHTKGIWADKLHITVPVFWLVMAVIITCAVLHWYRQTRCREKNGPAGEPEDTAPQ